MIAYLKGKIKSVGFEAVVLEVNGVGYGVRVSVRDAASLAVDQEAELLISEVIREQSFDLYGFTDLSEQMIFEQLLKVSGVGPRLAIALLGLGERDELYAAVSAEDASYLSRAPGVGKKLAEKIILELRDKVTFVSTGQASVDGGVPSGDMDVEAALLSLGFKQDDIRSMMKSVDKKASIEEQIKQALSRR